MGDVKTRITWAYAEVCNNAAIAAFPAFDRILLNAGGLCTAITILYEVAQSYVEFVS